MTRDVDGPDSAGDSATPGVEIERRFLLSSRPDFPAPPLVLTMRQGYLPDDSEPGGRIREVTHVDGTAHYVHTIKRGHGVAREETERPLDRAAFDALWPRTEGRRIAKTRHVVHDGPRTWDIDQFVDRDLVIAECELARADDACPIPTWLASYVVREITGDAAFSNYALATAGANANVRFRTRS